MNLIEAHNNKYHFFADITGVAMKVHSKYHGGLLESAYEAALKSDFCEGRYAHYLRKI